jgi:Rrf2 family protein
MSLSGIFGFGMISTTAQHALRAVVYIASQNEPFTNRAAIATATKVPSEYLLKVLGSLESAGIVQSKRGPGGGYSLLKSPAKLTVFEIVIAVDSIPRIKECPLGIATHKRLCPLDQLLDDASAKIEEAFRNTTVQALILGKPTLTTCEFPGRR